MALLKALSIFLNCLPILLRAGPALLQKPLHKFLINLLTYLFSGWICISCLSADGFSGVSLLRFLTSNALHEALLFGTEEGSSLVTRDEEEALDTALSLGGSEFPLVGHHLLYLPALLHHFRDISVVV